MKWLSNLGGWWNYREVRNNRLASVERAGSTGQLEELQLLTFADSAQRSERKALIIFLPLG